MIRQNYKLAFVFPGQGSQSVGMLSEFGAAYPEVKHVFERASDALGKNLWSIVTEGPDDELNQTHNTQPAMLAAGFAIWEVWCKHSKTRPGWMAGHSLGEYTALVCSDALSFEDGIKLVAERGRLMQEAVPAGMGAMAAILGLEDQQVVRVCADAAEKEVVSAVNFNAPGQVVIAGNVAAVERAMIAAKKAGAKRAVKLPVSVPSHCALMATAAEKLNEYLQNTVINMPKMTLIHNVDVAAHTAPEVIRKALKAQLYKPVRWSDTIRFMHNQDVTHFVECGPGKVLVGLNKRIVKNAEHGAIYNPETLNKVLEQLDD
ncbi:malonyl-CoA-(acyl-carrier-protein) transacylase [Candidatus Methylobacter favarea]|uniref:Malonyl CoA-acyl carrier protein transacylase n=1 Tax=Candidatus Methylobacter favarea TaxID=2707345 RepID=A0A8S0WZD8_9GAMM|nr:ACP S-malonyltransferase [Candidatus Methylobacter favarea]CAA9890125.1 malonyl-CoA-(acyl-carrier-protein) transacylase [Candidatus Methylobacter favarea]